MNLAFLLLTAAASAGAEPAPYAPSGASPAVVYSAAEPAPSHAEKPTFFPRLRKLFTSHKAAPREAAAGCSCGRAGGAARIAPTPVIGMSLPPHSEPAVTAYGTASPVPDSSSRELMRIPAGQPQTKVLAAPAFIAEPVKKETDASNPF